MHIKIAAAACMLLVWNCSEAGAQSKRKIKETYRSNPPKVVLVELFTYKNKAEYYTRTHQPEKAAQVKKDAAMIIKKTVADYNTNFKFCPVYYFYDTSAGHITRREFKGVLFDQTLQPVKQVPIAAGDTNYLIVNYGPAAISTKSNENEASTESSIDYGVGENVLISSFKSNILNYQFDPLPRFVLYDNHNFFTSHTNNYRYTSKKFNIYYRDNAAYLDRKFDQFYSLK